MTAIPKPERTGRASRKPLPRKTRLRRSCTPIARVSRVRPMSRSKRSQMEREAATLCSRITLARHPICEHCRTALSTEAAHVLAKGSWPAARFELSNLVALCHACHLELNEARLVGHSPMREFYIATRCRGAWNRLVWIASQQKTFGPDVLASLRQEARETGVKA